MTRLRVCAPPLVDPILPLLSRDLPRGADWRYELKLDGGTLYLEKNGARFRSKTGGCQAAPRAVRIRDEVD